MSLWNKSAWREPTKSWEGSPKILRRPMNISNSRLAEVGTCSLATFPFLVKGLCEVGEVGFTWWEKSEVKILLSSATFFFQIFESVFFYKILMEWSWKSYACCSWHLAVVLHAVWRTCCLSQKLRNWMEIDLGCVPVSFLKPYILSSSLFPLIPIPQHTHILICSDLCRVRNLTFSLLF